LSRTVPKTEQQRPTATTANDSSTPLVNGGKPSAPVGYHDDGYIVPYDIMLGVLAHRDDSPPLPLESTRL